MSTIRGFAMGIKQRSWAILGDGKGRSAENHIESEGEADGAVSSAATLLSLGPRERMAAASEREALLAKFSRGALVSRDCSASRAARFSSMRAAKALLWLSGREVVSMKFSPSRAERDPDNQPGFIGFVRSIRAVSGHKNERKRSDLEP